MLTHGQIILLSTAVISGIITYGMVSILVKTSGSGSVIREQGPKHHKEKAKIPSTGGRAFLVAMAISYPLAFLFVKNRIIEMVDPRAVIAVFTGLLTGLIGLADDKLKLMKGNSSGLKARYKLPLQILVGLMLVFSVVYFLEDTTIRIPFVKGAIDIGYWKIPVSLFVYLTIINGVNFTDGLDGLAASTVLIASVFLAGVLWTTGGSTAVAPMILIGICAGFLPHNWNPAKIFMGDAGALTISGALAGAAIAAGLEIAILIIGIVFLIEISSVVLQVVYFRLTGGKRIFRMTPIHHAWELRGYKEKQIVLGASVVGIIGGGVGWLVSVN